MSNHPTTIGGKYSVVRRLGKGGMGTVFEAISQENGERVAVKVIAADLAEDQTLVTRFQREARAAAGLDTPHIVKVYEAGVDSETKLPFMAMEYLEGEDLRQVLKRTGPLPAVSALSIAAQACRALEAAHAAKILHRDIKPANLFLAKKDGGRVVKLLDFGVAKVQHPELTGDAEVTNLTRTGSMIGSPLYMSPEQARGYRNIDGRSDLWSLGVVLYQMLAGRTPHAKIDELGELLVRICTEPPPPIQRRAPWVPPTVAEIVHLSLGMEPDDRFPTAGALLAAIESLLPDGAVLTEESLRPLTDLERGTPAAGVPATFIDDPTTRRRRGGDPFGVSGSNPTGVSGRYSFTGPGETGAQGVSDPPTGPSGVRPPQQVSTLTNIAATSSVLEPAVPAAPPDKKPWRIAAIGLVAGLVAAGVYFGVARPAQTSEGGAAAQGTGAQVDSKPRSVKLVVLPKDAKVEVDGAAVESADGLVEITGSLGSVHKTRVTLGAETKVVEVAITENGPAPAKIEIEPAKTAPPPGPTATASAAATAQPEPRVAGPLGTKPKPTATAATTPTATTTTRALRDDR